MSFPKKSIKKFLLLFMISVTLSCVFFKNLCKVSKLILQYAKRCNHEYVEFQNFNGLLLKIIVSTRTKKAEFQF